MREPGGWEGPRPGAAVSAMRRTAGERIHRIAGCSATWPAREQVLRGISRDPVHSRLPRRLDVRRRPRTSPMARHRVLRGLHRSFGTWSSGPDVGEAADDRGSGGSTPTRRASAQTAKGEKATPLSALTGTSNEKGNMRRESRRRRGRSWCAEKHGGPSTS